VAHVPDITDSQFETEVLQSDQTVLVDFWAPWCGPCRLIAPLMDWAAQTYGDRLKVLKLEVDPNPETVSRYQVQGIPTLILFRAGEVIARTEGALNKDRLKDLLDAHL
jgi:thioredoxin 1